jgi:hypothetical protein
MTYNATRLQRFCLRGTAEAVNALYSISDRRELLLRGLISVRAYKLRNMKVVNTRFCGKPVLLFA